MVNGDLIWVAAAVVITACCGIVGLVGVSLASRGKR